MTERTVFICESSKALNGVAVEECNLSYQEQIEKAKKDCVECSVCNTMSPDRKSTRLNSSHTS